MGVENLAGNRVDSAGLDRLRRGSKVPKIGRYRMDRPIFHQERASKGEAGRPSYRFGGVIGRGLASTVYIAERVQDGLTVAIKILDRSMAHDPDHLQRFIREGKLVSKVHSPYVVNILEQGFTNRYGFIAMEFFGRGNLKRRIENGLSIDDAVDCLKQIACGLQAIHGAGVVHRDLKPANIVQCFLLFHLPE